MNITQAKLKGKLCGLEISCLSKCVLMKVKTEEEKQVEREKEDKSAQVWRDVAYI